MLVNNYSREICPEQSGAHQQPESGLTDDELNAMQFACGFVPHKLLKKYETRSGQKVEQFVACLKNMAVTIDDDDDKDLLSYTKVWFEVVNRNGLFPINKQTFYFFITVEEKVRVLLPTHISKNDASKDIKCVIEEIMKNDNVQF